MDIFISHIFIEKTPQKSLNSILSETLSLFQKQKYLLNNKYQQVNLNKFYIFMFFILLFFA